MRALSMDELSYVSGGSIERGWGGSGGVRWRVLGSGSGLPHDPPDVYTVRGDQQDTGWFDDEGPMQGFCTASFRSFGGFAGTTIGTGISAALTSVEIALGVLAAPVTGGVSAVGSIVVAGATVNLFAVGGGVVGFAAGSAVGEWAC